MLRASKSQAVWKEGQVHTPPQGSVPGGTPLHGSDFSRGQGCFQGQVTPGWGCVQPGSGVLQPHARELVIDSSLPPLPRMGLPGFGFAWADSL